MQHSQPEIEETPLVAEQELADTFQGTIVPKLNVPDLPLELWKEVLAYLPRGFVRKLIGINRYLFEMGMDELYEEVRLMDYNGAGLKTFEQMRHANIASRVRRLYIRPTFLPGVDCKGKAVYDRGQTSAEFKLRELEIRRFLETALESLTHCVHLQEVTIVVHDQYPTRCFLKFLGELMKRVATRLRTLTIDMTLPCFLSIHHVFNPKLLFNLSSLTINTTFAHFEPSRWQAYRINRALRRLILPLEATFPSVRIRIRSK